MLSNVGTRPAQLLLAGSLLVLTLGPSGDAALADDAGKAVYGRRSNPEARAAMQRQQAEAMARLSPQQRQQYFTARRELEQRAGASGWISCSRPSAVWCRPARWRRSGGVAAALQPA